MDRLTAAVGSVLGILALIACIAMALMAFVIGVYFEMLGWQIGAIIAAVCSVAGLAMSLLAFFRRREGQSNMKMAAGGLLTNVAVVAALIAGVSLVVSGFAEPSIDDAVDELVQKGLQVHTIGGNRPALLALPGQYDPGTPVPLVLSLHGFSGHYMASDAVLGLTSLVNRFNFALVLPNGTKDEDGNRFWNATDFCCGKTDDKPDDVAYLTGLVQESAKFATVGPVLVVGLSNGGFMAYRLACESTRNLAGIVVVGGSGYADPERCASADPVPVLHMHGVDDSVVRIGGGSNLDIGPGSYPSIEELVRRWAGRAGCDLSSPEILPRRDIDRRVDGTETHVTRFSTGCDHGLVVEYWWMEGTPHSPRPIDDFGEQVITWLYDRVAESGAD